MVEDKKLIFKTALRHFQEGRWDKTIVDFKRLVALDPGNLNARNILADAYVKKGAVKEAYGEYASAAEGHSKKGESEKAKVIYKKITKLNVNGLDPAQQQQYRVISLGVRGDGAFEEGKYEEALQTYQEMASLDKQNMEVVAKLAETYARLGQNREAVPYCLTVAKYYLEGRLFKRALLFFQKVTELDPSNVDARLELGELLAREGQDLEARKEFQSVAEHFIAQGDLDKAQQCCQRAIQLKSIDAHYLLGDIFFRRHQYDEARSELESFLKIKVDHVPAQYSLAVCLLNKGLLDEAIGCFGKILGKQPDHVGSLERMAETYEKKGAATDAIVQLLSLASVLRDQKIMDRAEAAIRKALTLDPQHLDAHKRMAELYEMRGMKREAANEYCAALKLAQASNLATEVAQCEEKIKAIDPTLLKSIVPPAPAPAASAPHVPATQVAPLPLAAPTPPPPTPTPPPPKPQRTLQQQAQRLQSMAQSALKQGLYDEALDLLQQARQLMPEDEELKVTVQGVLREYAKGTPSRKQAATSSPPSATPAPPPQILSSPAGVEAAELPAVPGGEAGAPGEPVAVSGEEPVTPTMAEIYFKQGHLAEALRLYGLLLNSEPGRADYQERIEEIRVRLTPAEKPPVKPQAAPRPAAEPPRATPEPAKPIPAPKPGRARPRVSYV